VLEDRRVLSAGGLGQLVGPVLAPVTSVVGPTTAALVAPVQPVAEAVSVPLTPAKGVVVTPLVNLDLNLSAPGLARASVELDLHLGGKASSLTLTLGPTFSGEGINFLELDLKVNRGNDAPHLVIVPVHLDLTVPVTVTQPVVGTVNPVLGELASVATPVLPTPAAVLQQMTGPMSQVLVTPANSLASAPVVGTAIAQASGVGRTSERVGAPTAPATPGPVSVAPQQPTADAADAEVPFLPIQAANDQSALIIPRTPLQQADFIFFQNRVAPEPVVILAQQDRPVQESLLVPPAPVPLNLSQPYRLVPDDQPEDEDPEEVMDLAAPPAGGLVDAGAADVNALEQAFEQFLTSVTDVEQGLLGWLRLAGPAPWILMGLALVGAGYGSLWQRRRRGYFLAADGGDVRLDWFALGGEGDC